MGLKIWNLLEVQTATAAKLLSQKTEQFDGVGTDTRQDLKGKLFVALRGDQFDAHNFLDQAIQKGAVGLIIDREDCITEEIKSKCSIFLVKDTLAALQSLGHFFRKTNEQMNFVGITGSNGKTTTKEFAAQIISTVRKTHWSQASFNNHWGVPITLLNTPMDSQVVIVEMGMNHAGELKRLAEIAEPQAVVCTMVGRAHVEFFETMQNLAQAKQEIYKYSPTSATHIYNLDNEWTHQMYEEYQKEKDQNKRTNRVLTFSQKNSSADLYFNLEKVGFQELVFSGKILNVQGRVQVKVFGLQNMTNLLAASALAVSCGLTPEQVWKALPQCQTSWGRNQLEILPSGVQLLFDAYNANPDSMAALLDNLKRLSTSGRKIAVLGQMLEMGSASAQLHEELGLKAAESNLDQVYFLGTDWEAFQRGYQKGIARFSSSEIGPDSKVSSHPLSGENVSAYPGFSQELADQLGQSLKSGDLVAFKASRGMKFERFLTSCGKKI